MLFVSFVLEEFHSVTINASFADLQTRVTDELGHLGRISSPGL